jgi:Xaa-Pro aminopeptidase
VSILRLGPVTLGTQAWDEGQDATEKLRHVRNWIKTQPPSVPSYSRSPPTPAQMHVATLITSLSNIGTSRSPNILVEFLTDIEFPAWLLNLRGSDIPYNPLFQSYLFIGLSRVVLFADSVKVTDEVAAYLRSIGVERREYNDLWTFLRRREWGEGKVRIHISYCSF